MRPVVLVLLLPLVALAQAPDFPAPKTFPPDEPTLKKITDRMAELKKATAKIEDPDVLVYLKAAEWIVKHGEWYTEKSAQQTLDVLDAGLERAKNAEKKPWLAVRGKPIIRAYTSDVDGSVQPYAIRYPDDFDPKKDYRVDLILHGRDATLTEVKFLHAKETAKKGQSRDFFEIDIYGRGNNAYRWAGETDLWEARQQMPRGVDIRRVVLRGFSMGGAGTWHIGLRHPFEFAVLGPGAGFSTTREYIGEKKFGPQPDYIEKCLHIYDAVDYAENCFNVPVVAYSGEKDKQRLAADLIEAKLKEFKEPHSFTHVVAPGLEHSQPAEWQKKLEDEYVKHLKEKRPEVVERTRFVTYTPNLQGREKPLSGPRLLATALEKQYEKAVIDATNKSGELSITTSNVRVLSIIHGELRRDSITVDGAAVPFDPRQREVKVERVDGKWKVAPLRNPPGRLLKSWHQCGPIDDAFCNRFVVLGPTEAPWHTDSGKFTAVRRDEFARNWEKYFRGSLPTITLEQFEGKLLSSSVVLFGDPQSNSAIAKVLPKLPITWTKEELVVNGKKYDPKTHLPVLIYPNPEKSSGYVVINSGHTFREADLKGTNALLYPRLGDWAVLKPAPTKDDPAAFEVVDAGLFDENWQFVKKK